MSDSRVLITAEAEQAIREFERLRAQAGGSLRGLREAGDSTLQRVGNSAAQTANAMRQIPAQFSDIIAGIQGGQAPLTILLQQGGQLRDTFGGAGAAVKGMATYVLSLVNPYTVAAAAAGALAIAFVQGRAEATAYTRALTMSGNAVGKTAGELADMARKISGAVGTQGAAAEAITAIVATGKVSAANLEQFSAVAIKAQRALGQSVADTATEFADLGKTPLASLEKLNEKYHFLTGSVYEQVKALQDQGRSYDAAALAQKTYATGLDAVVGKVNENLGAMQRFWNGVKDVAKGAWDAMLNVGRKDTLAEQLARVRAEIDKAQQPSVNRRGMYDLGADEQSRVRAKLAANLQLEASLAKQIESERHMAEIQADQAKFNNANLEWSRTKTQYLSRAGQLTNELKSAQELGLAAGVSDIEINKRLTAVRMKYSDIYNDGIDSQIAALKRRGALEDVLEKRSLDQIAAERAAGSITDDEAINRKADLELKAFDRSKTMAEQELEFTKRKQNSLKDQAELSGQIAVIDQQRRSRALQQETDLFALEQQRARAAVNNYADVIDKATAERDSLRAQTLAQQDQNDRLGLSKIQIADLDAQMLETLATRKEDNAAIADGIDLTGRLSQAYRDQAAALRGRAAGVRAGAAKEQGLGIDVTRATEILAVVTALDEAAQNTASGMQSAFGKVGSAIGGMTTALTKFARTQAAVNAELASAKRDAYGDPTKLAVAQARATQATANAQIQQYGDMASAAKGFFTENSKGYKLMESTEKAFRAYQMAMDIQAMLTKSGLLTAFTGLFVASKTTEMAVETTKTGVSVGLAATETSAWGATAVVKALASLPFPLNLAAGAATLAAVVAMGAKLMGSISGGDVDISKQRQAATGTGSILGDSSAKSDSIARSLTLAAQNSNIELQHTAGMLSALRNIESSIGGLVSLLVRGSGVTGAVAPDTLGTAASFVKSLPLMGGWIGSKIGSLANSIFGGNTTTLDTGLTLGRSTLGNVLNGGVSASQYNDTKTDGGWFSGDKYDTKTQYLSAEANAQFSKVIGSMADGVKEAGKLLGVDGDAFNQRLNGFVVDIGKISLKGLTGEQIQQQLEAAFSKLGDDMARSAVGGLDQFQRVGEGYLETLTRIGTDYANLDSILSASGSTFGAVGLGSISARERLIDLAGGIDDLASVSSSFADSFLTEAQRLAPVQKYVTEQLAAMGLAGIDTRDEFRDTVLGLASSGALATEAGAKQYTGLLALADAFAKTHAATEDLTLSEQAIADQRKDLQSQLDELTMTAEQLHAKERATIAASNLALYDQVSLQKKLADSTAAASDALKGTVERLTATRVSSLAYRDSLVLGSLSTLTPLQRAVEAQRQYTAALEKAKAKPDDSAAQSAVQSAATTFLTASQVINASSSAYVADKVKVLTDMATLADIAGAQMTDAQRQLSALDKQTAGIDALNVTAVAIEQGIAQLGAAGGAVAPSFDLQRYSAQGSPGADALVAEIKLLRADYAEALAELRKFHADANRNADDAVAAVEQLGEEVSDGLQKAATAAEWISRNPSRQGVR